MSDEIEEVETEGPIDQENDQDSLESLKRDLQYAWGEMQTCTCSMSPAHIWTSMLEWKLQRQLGEPC